MTRILNAEPVNFSIEASSILNELGSLAEEPTDRARLLEIIPEFEVLIVRLRHRVDDELLARGERLQVVVSATTGTNHIDLEAMRNRGIELLCLKGEKDFLNNVTATAEHSWALLLGLMRKIPMSHDHVLSGGWNRDQFRGCQLKGKTLGILGFGRLGKMVANYGKAFQMNVLAADPFVTEYPDWVEPLGLSELLQRSDVVSIHVNLNDLTAGLMGHEAFAQMKPGSVLINTSRGELIDEAALLKVLESGHLVAAGLDVLDRETCLDPQWLKNKPLLHYARTHDNLLLTPHIGGATVESMEDAELFMAQKLRRFLRQLR